MDGVVRIDTVAWVPDRMTVSTVIDTVEVMDIQGHTPFKARGGLGVAGYGLDMV